MTTKVQRQGAVAQLIADHDVTSHTQLVTLLKKSGIVATQATVSRDLEDIGAVKVRTSHGETAYHM
jgi:transcriptional regulator of arginine metabolism